MNGSFDMIWPEHEQIFAYQRKLHGKTLTVVANFSDHEAQLPNALEQGEVLIGEAIVEGALAPWQSFAILS